MDGGMVGVYNKTGEVVVQLHADEYGNGVVGAYDRKGMGRTLQPGSLKIARCGRRHRMCAVSA